MSPTLDRARHELKTVFGYDAFRGPQEAIVGHVADGGDALVLMPTGGGKSLCYQVPALLREGTTVVVSPLIALMKDQVDALRQLGVDAAFLNSSLGPRDARDVEERLARGELKLLYVAPERLVTERFLGLLDRARVGLFAIDEAHCVSQWGHDFRPEYLGLAVLAERYPGVPRVALTATADDATRREMVERLHLHGARQFVSSFDRPNITYRVVEKASALKQVHDFIRTEHPGDAGIVYCLSRQKVEDTAAYLAQQGIRALPYHAGLTNDVRARHQERFLREEGVVMVATVAFGMGIDKPDVRFVAHLDLPKSMEGYYQETGRAGRDGLPSTAWMAYGLADAVQVRRMLAQSDAPEEIRRVESRKLDALLAYAETATCRRQVLLRYFGETHPGACGNCDTCLSPVDTWDATVAAQKLVSAAHRTGKRFGVTHLVDVLMGRDSAKIHAMGHDRLSVYGIGRDLNEKAWKSVARHLVAGGYLSADDHGGLQPTGRATPLLRGEEQVLLRRETDRPQKSAKRAPSVVAPQDEELFADLRALRSELARNAGLPPYTIFHDATLKQMAEERPQTLAALANVSGVGASKLERYGERFLTVLRGHAPAEPRRAPEAPLWTPAPRAATSSARGGGTGDTLTVTLDLAREGHSIEEIARQRGLTAQTISKHLANLVRDGQLSFTEATGLGDDDLRVIERAYHTLPEEQRTRLAPLREATAERYDFERLRVAHAVITE
ncbi:DNA helicase RecQ [Deinococcus pimensis]|uniref:DNA helicase RecQ n=1 Tax=Deinococcus pimensis TaxID=309888 RepID=UPI0004BB2855|nr:DNA helicase RecQ [Deinococcus pimensis]